MGGVQQDQAGYLAGETVRIVACVEAAEGMTDQQMGSGHVGGPQQLAQLVGHGGGGPRQVNAVAPPVQARS